MGLNPYLVINDGFDKPLPRKKDQTSGMKYGVGDPVLNKECRQYWGESKFIRSIRIIAK